jgi:hypothetical protein
MSVADDHAADRRLGGAIAVLVILEVVFAFLADANTIGLLVWLVLAVGAVLVVAAAAAALQRRAEPPPASE